MPSLGSPKLVVRLADGLKQQIQERIKKINLTRRDEPYTLTTWIVHVIRGELAHLSAADLQRQKRKACRSPRLKRLAKIHASSPEAVGHGTDCAAQV